MPVPKAASELDDLIYRATYANSTTIYHGHAPPGSAQNAPVWRIKRQTLDSNGRTIAILYADGNASFDNVFSNAASLDYA